jgi:hypothetical protein
MHAHYVTLSHEVLLQNLELHINVDLFFGFLCLELTVLIFKERIFTIL